MHHVPLYAYFHRSSKREQGSKPEESAAKLCLSHKNAPITQKIIETSDLSPRKLTYGHCYAIKNSL